MASSPITNANNNDSEPPIITFQEKGLVAETWTQIYWTTDELTIGGVEWGLTSQYGNTEKETGNYSTYHFINLTGLTRATNYYVRIFAIDQNNNTGYFTFELGTYPIGVDEEYDDLLLISSVVLGILLVVAVFTILYLIRKNKKKR